MTDRAVASLIKVHGESHPLVAEVLLTRGTAHAALGDRAAAIRDFERTAAILATQQLNPGTRAAAIASCRRGESARRALAF